MRRLVPFRADFVSPTWGFCLTYVGGALVVVPGWSGLAFGFWLREPGSMRLSDAVGRRRGGRAR